MELFSKRYSSRDFRFRFGKSEDPDNFLTEALRKRLQNEVKFIVSSLDYIEKILLLDNQKQEKIYLHDEILRDLSLREIGYDITKVIDCYTLSFDTPEYTDVKFLDLLEILIIFTKEEKRVELTQRFTNILQEETPNISINDFMIIIKNETWLRSIIPLLKDRLLKEKLSSFYDASFVRPNYESLCRISADILQFIFSSDKSKKDTKKYAENLIKELCKKRTTKSKVEELFGLVNILVNNAKAFNNTISNIRHTDRTTIQLDSPNFYKLISQQNINVIELVILTFPEKYIKIPNSKSLKDNYCKKYNTDPSSGYYIAKPKIPDELPF